MIDLEKVRRCKPREILFDSRPNLTPAAVMILAHRARGDVVFIVRSNSVRTHRGQIGLPGGVVEEGESPLEAAFRETHEEIGLARASPISS